MKNLTYTLSIELFKFHLSTSAKLKTCFSRRESLKKCTSLEEQKGTRYIRRNVYFDIIVSAIFVLQNRISNFF